MSAIEHGVGPFYIGTLLNVAIFGVNWMQMFDYFRVFQDDRWLVKGMVIVVFVVSFVHSCFSAYINWDLFIANFGNAPHLASSPWSFSVDPVCTAVVACIVQLHYTWRVYIIGKRSLWMPVIIAVLTLLQLALGVYLTAIALSDPLWTHLHRRLDWAVATWLFAMATADVCITGSITYHLRQVRSDFEQTNSLVDRIVRNIVANNALTAICAVCSGVLFVASTNTGWHVIFGLTVSRFYVLSLLSSLNARQTLRPGLSSSTHGTVQTGKKGPGSAAPFNGLHTPYRTPLPSSPCASAINVGSGRRDEYLHDDHDTKSGSSPRSDKGTATHLSVSTQASPPRGQALELTAPTATSRLLQRPSFLRSFSSSSERSGGREKDMARTFGTDSLPITVQIDTEETIEDESGDSWDPRRFYSNPTPSLPLSRPGTAEGRQGEELDSPPFLGSGVQEKQ
ncbi:DUF6534 domain-containing protein [Rhodotorula paludigena]|uniref:DUF6534 domain-containing protein n=1 Tax=Rhodotorula paludigena TaxID=86838 RepID=UPI0031810332